MSAVVRDGRCEERLSREGGRFVYEVSCYDPDQGWTYDPPVRYPGDALPSRLKEVFAAWLMQQALA